MNGEAGELVDRAAPPGKSAPVDEQLHAIQPDDRVTEAIRQPECSLTQAYSLLFDAYATHPALGERAWRVAETEGAARVREYLDAFATISYAELGQRVTAIATAWRWHDKHAVRPGEFIALFGQPGTDITTGILAAIFAQAVHVPLLASQAADDIRTILGEIEPAAMLVDIRDVERMLPFALATSSLRSFVVLSADLRIDEDARIIERARAALAEAGHPIALATIDELIAFGRERTFEPLPADPAGKDAMLAILYTSGSTGKPKGAIYSEAIVRLPILQVEKAQANIALVFAGMNHSLGYSQVFRTLAQGGTALFTLKSDMTSLFDDLRISRPTHLNLFPRVVEQIYQYFLGEVLHRVSRGQARAEAEAEVRQAMTKTFLGDRLVFAVVGGAPISREIYQFFVDTFGIPLCVGYGSTETSGVTFDGRVDRRFVTDFELRDVPELGYSNADRPWPRGELAVKTRSAIPGYYKDAKATAGIRDENGWILTGDVFELREGEELVWIDRRNNVLKLSQGEYVALTQLEIEYAGSVPWIRQIYLYGTSFRPNLVAVIVPDRELAAERLGHPPDETELRSLLYAGLTEAAHKAGLRKFEIPRDFIIEDEPFTIESGLLSTIRKPLRAAFNRKYQERLEALYDGIAARQREEVLMLRNPDSGLAIEDRIAMALRATLGRDDIDLSGDPSFLDLGGDSFDAITFSMLLEDVFGTAISAGAILSPTGTPRRWAEMVRGSQEHPGLTFAAVHGTNAQELDSADLDPARLLPEGVSAGASPAADPTLTRVVLVTGANGFLGRFVTLEWLERLAPHGGRVIALVRGVDEADARRRLEDSYGADDVELTKRFRELAADHLEVVAADLGERGLGIDAAVLDDLAQRVDRIVHVGALVNHRMSYKDLFQPNVAGTLALIELALAERIKPIDFVSSQAVSGLPGAGGADLETADIRAALPRITLGDTYASGYAASKWAGEVLLRYAHEQFGLPVNVFRCGMLMAHRKFGGQINVPDLFIRLVASLVLAGVRPPSFYADAADPAGFEGLPVDHVARAMVDLALAGKPGYRSFDVAPSIETGSASLDHIADWIESAGYRLDRPNSHSEWLAQLEARLERLSAEARQSSALPILSAFAAPMPRSQRRAGGAFADALRDSDSEASPALTEAYLHKHLADMRQHGLIPPASKGLVQ